MIGTDQGSRRRPLTRGPGVNVHHVCLGSPDGGTAGKMVGMFKVTFWDVNRDRGLTGAIFLPALPQQGEVVRIRDKANDYSFQAGHVVRREWTIVNKEPTESEVYVYVALD